MKTQKEAVEEVIEMWKLGDQQAARFLTREYKYLLSPRIYKYLYEKTGTTENNSIHKSLIYAQKIMGGTIYDQFGVEVTIEK